MFRRLPTLSPVAWTAVERVTQQILWLVLFAILAPILGPRPYGLFAIGSVFVGFCEFALMEGAIEALVTVDELDHMHTTTANLANGAIAFGLSLLICALAPAIGSLFGDDEIKFIMWALSPMPVLSALSAVPVAVLRRSLHYKELAVRSILGLVIGGVIGIIAGLAGAGVWALTLQVLTQRFAEFVIVWIAAPVRMTFGWSRSHFRELSPVALNVLVARTMNVANGILPRIILGYTLGATELGLFTLANRFLEVIVQTAIVPRTSVGRIELRDSNYGSAEFERTFAMMTQGVSLLAFPILLGAAALTPDLFRLWLGESWQAGIVPAQLLLLSGLPLVLFYCIDAALLAANMSSTFKWLSMLQTVSIAVVVLGASFSGLVAVCIALAIRPWIILPFSLLVLRRKCHVSPYRVLRQPMSCFIGAVIMAAILSLPFLRPSWFYQTFDFALLIVGGVVFYGLFLYSFSRTQLKAAIGGVPILRRALER